MGDEKVYILLTDTGTIFTRMIKFYTKKPYNHASISFDSKLDEVYSFGRKNVNNPFIGGFVIENIKESIFKEATCAVFCCPITGLQKRKMGQFIQKIKQNEHLYHYNFLGLFAVILNKQLRRENAFFCSQFVASVLKESDTINFSKPLSLITPHDLQESPGFQLVYKGKLRNYLSESDQETCGIHTSKEAISM
ncbi:hypothetical protein [Virgibacillus oceani]|uniref:Uncharacterized protein n=1 Tax=Virgibacillus oceani TaxID=1479511 RepID=A0A917HJF8_9BACI|nr:hypothetical protein [Virgibacillus oceani]GGG80520.1 hypothetical protein GCM10011398_27400 [Virgibacillus oceani]